MNKTNRNKQNIENKARTKNIKEVEIEHESYYAEHKGFKAL